MAIPDYQTCMLHLLRLASDGTEHTLKDAVAALADTFKLTEAERAELLPSGQQAVFNNRVGWASTYLKKAGLLCAPRRGVFMITDRGQKCSRPKSFQDRPQAVGAVSRILGIQSQSKDVIRSRLCSVNSIDYYRNST